MLLHLLSCEEAATDGLQLWDLHFKWWILSTVLCLVLSLLCDCAMCYCVSQYYLTTDSRQTWFLPKGRRQSFSLL
jgi:hypothetical protein